jgi:hypothetical protein
MLRGFGRFFVSVLALFLPVLPAAAQGFSLRVIVESERETPIGIFRNVALQAATRQGQVFFLADYESRLDEDDQALFFWNAGEIVRLIGRDDDVPGGEIRSVLSAVVAPRSGADRAFVATVRDGGEVREALFVSAERRIERILRVGDTLEDGTFLGVREGSLQVNGSGDVLFLANLDADGNGRFDPGTDRTGLYAFIDFELKRLSVVGETRFGGRVTSLRLGRRALNDQERIAWETTVEGEAGIESLIVIAERADVRNVLRSGVSAPGGRLLNPRSPELNEPGNVAFAAAVDGNGNGIFEADRDRQGVFLFRPDGSPGALTLLQSELVERGDTLVLTVTDLNDINQALATLQVDTNRNEILDAGDREAIYRAATSGVVAMARGGRRLRFGGDIRGGELRLRLDDALLNRGGAAAIGGFVDGDESGDFDPRVDEAGIYYSNRGNLVAVARDRQLLGRSQLLNTSGPARLTDANAIVFSADIDRDFDETIDPDDEGRAILIALPR